MKNVALVTGASSGIGLELARIHAKNGGNLVVVARSKDKLDELKNELENRYNVSVFVIQSDLSKQGAAEEIYKQTKQAKLFVKYLINNAGFGDCGMFYEMDLAIQRDIINVNLLSLTELTHMYLADMVANGGGKVLNVASMVAFTPVPLIAVYSATKAYVLSFSSALSEEMREFNVSVTALCPGVVDTNFSSGRNFENTKIFQFAKDAKSVAELGYKAMLDSKIYVSNEIWINILSKFISLIPIKLLVKIIHKVIKNFNKKGTYEI